MTLCGARRVAGWPVPAQCQARHAPVSGVSGVPGGAHCHGKGNGRGYGYGYGYLNGNGHG